MFDFIINETKILTQLGGIWIILLLIFARTIGFISTAPLIGSKQIPTLVKVGFAIVLSLIFMPMIDTPSEYPKGYKFIYLIFMNAAIGMFIGWVSSLVIEIARVAGEMLDSQMALNAATVFDPGTQSQTTIMGHFFNMLGLVIFVSIGGMEKVIEGLFKSYNTFPVIVYSFNFNFLKVLKATADLISIAFLVVSPIIMILLTVDLILGLMSRAAPQINAFQVSFSIKPSVGILLILILLPALFQILAKLFLDPNRYLY